MCFVFVCSRKPPCEIKFDDKNIKKQDAIIANQKKIVKSMNELNNTGNVLKGSVSKTAGNGTQDGVAKKKEPSKKIQAEE